MGRVHRLIFRTIVRRRLAGRDPSQGAAKITRPNRPSCKGCAESLTDYTCAKPPSTNNSVPVTKLASFEARNTTALAISSAVPSLPSGTLLEIFFKRCWPVSEDPTRPFSPGVSMEPGLTAFTRLQRSFTAVVHVRANERMAALVAL